MPSPFPVPRRALDLAASPRAAAFDFYRGFNQPFFGVCVRVDATALKPALAAAGRGSVTLALHFVALRLAAASEPWRTRLDDAGRAWLYDTVHASTTVLKPDGSFGFATLEQRPRFDEFCRAGTEALAAARDGGFVPLEGELALIHFTSLPWLHFTQFTHARQVGGADSCPKIAFGRIDTDRDGRAWLPLAIDAHHALMDGLHVGRYVQGFEAALAEPMAWIQGGAWPDVAPDAAPGAAPGAATVPAPADTGDAAAR